MSSPPWQSIFVLTHEFYPKRGGIATFTEEMAIASAQIGYKVEVWAQDPRGRPEKHWPFAIHRLPLRGSHDLSCQIKLAWQLVRHRRRLRYATVYLPEPGPMLGMMLLQGLQTFRPKRLILTFHGSEILKFSRNPLVRPFARRLIKRAERVSVLSNYSLQLLEEHFPEATGKVILTPGALRSDFAVVTPKERERSDRVIILTVGRLHPRKGQLITLQSLQALAPRFRQQIEYWIVGSGTKPRYEQALRETAATCDFPVKFLGDLPDRELDQVYDRADVFAMTSVDYGHSVEGFGLVYLEASAHGLPVVAHSVGGVSEAVVDHVTGLLVPPHHPAQLTAAFEKLISDRDLRLRLGAAGRDFSRRQSWSQSARLLFSPSEPAAFG